MNRLDRAAYTVSLVLLIGGFGLAGVGAGTYFSIAEMVRVLDCGIASPTDCAALAASLNGYTQTFLVGGSVSMIAGGIGLWSVTRHEQKGEGVE